MSGVKTTTLFPLPPRRAAQPSRGIRLSAETDGFDLPLTLALSRKERGSLDSSIRWNDVMAACYAGLKNPQPSNSSASAL